MKHCADKYSHCKPHKLSVGDLVLPRQPKVNKSSTPFQAEPFRITEVKGSKVTATSKDQTLTRNASHFKLLPSDIEVPFPSTPKEKEEGDKNEQDLNDLYIQGVPKNPKSYWNHLLLTFECPSTC